MRNDKSIVIGLTGSFGSGCTTAAKHLKDKGFLYYSLSGWIKKICKSRKLLPTRRNLQDIGDELRKNFSSPTNIYDYFVRVFLTEFSESRPRLISKLVESGGIELRSAELDHLKKVKLKIERPIVIRGIRNNMEADTLVRVFQDNFFLINIDTDFDIRWNRIQKNKKREYKKREYFEIDDERDSGEYQPPWGQQVEKCVSEADIVIDNNREGERYLFSKLDKYLALIERKAKFDSHKDEPEAAMYKATILSKTSKCFKRLVGAVLVKNGEIIGEGYNDGPRKENLCFRYRECYRDTVRLCPRCGNQLGIIFDKCINPKCKEIVSKRVRENLLRNLDLCRAVHAEERAILDAFKKHPEKVEGSILYCTTFPCLICARIILETKINKVVYVDPYPSIEGKLLFNKYSDLTVEKFEGIKSERVYKFFKNRNKEKT